MRQIHLSMMAALCCLLMTSCGDDEPQRMTYESVDLGLSVKWATMNVGAQQPEDYGQLFGWADSTGSHKKFDNIDISFRTETDGQETTIVEWNSVYFGGKTPYSNISGTPYDIALFQWNNKWRMPTLDEWNELISSCTWTTETTASGSTVYRVTGPNGNSIILPLSGIRSVSDQTIARGTRGCYWTSTLLPIGMQEERHYESDVACAAWCVNFSATEHPQVSTDIRCYGMSVRPVAK